MPLDAGQTTKQQAGQVNFAPVESLRRLKDRPEDAYTESSFHQVVRELHQNAANQNLEMRRQIAEIGRLVSNLRSGKEMLRRDPIHGTYALIKPLPQRSRQDRHIVPLAQTNSSQITSIWTLSRPRLTVRHFGNNNHAQIQHALIESIIAHYNAELMDELFHQQESLSMMDYGTSVINVFYDQNRNPLIDAIPVINNSEKVLFPGYAVCVQCGMEGSPDDFAAKGLKEFPRCPQCGAVQDAESMIPPISAPVAEIVGMQEYQQGDIGLELLPVPACNWDYRHMVQDSPYFQYVSEVSSRAVESLLNVELGSSSHDDDWALEIITSIGLRGGSVVGLGREQLQGYTSWGMRTTRMHEDHYLPEQYAGIRLSKAEKTVGGLEIPAGVPLDEVFPDGLKVIGFSDMDVLIGAYNEKRRTVSGIYHLQSFSGVGKGVSDVIEISEQLNEAHSAALAQLKRYGAGGGYAYDKSVLTQTEAQRLLKPGGLVGANLRGTPYTNINNALMQVSNNELSQSNLTMIAQLTNLMNLAFQTTDFTTGVADSRVDINTLGGQQMLQAQNQQRTAAPLRMKGRTHALVFEQIIALFREHIQIPKWFGNQDRFALVKGRFIQGKDLPETIKCDFVNDSEIPQNSFTKRESAKQMVADAGNLGVSFLELTQVSPRIALWWCSQFNIDMPLLNQTELLMVCQDRIDQLKELSQLEDLIAQLSGFYGDPNEIALTLVDQLKRRVQFSEENHALKAQLLEAYLDDDEVSTWSPTMVAAVESLIQRHYEFDRDQRFRLQNLEQEGQLMLAQKQAEFQMQMAMQQQQAQMAMQAEQLDAQNAQAMETEALRMLADEAQRDEDAARQEEQAQADHARTMEIEKVRGRNRNRPQKK